MHVCSKCIMHHCVVYFRDRVRYNQKIFSDWWKRHQMHIGEWLIPAVWCSGPLRAADANECGQNSFKRHWAIGGNLSSGGQLDGGRPANWSVKRSNDRRPGVIAVPRIPKSSKDQPSRIARRAAINHRHVTATWRGNERHGRVHGKRSVRACVRTTEEVERKTPLYGCTASLAAE